MKIILPIYYTIEKKTKKSQTILVWMNWYRNAHFHISNKVKEYYHRIIKEQIIKENIWEFKTRCDVYIKNINSDPSNIESLMIKFTLDALQEYWIIENDNIKYHKWTLWWDYQIDKLNPRCEVTILENN
jgi:hypothetical protein